MGDYHKMWGYFAADIAAKNWTRSCEMQEKLDKVLLICSFLEWDDKMFGHF